MGVPDPRLIVIQVYQFSPCFNCPTDNPYIIVPYKDTSITKVKGQVA